MTGKRLRVLGDYRVLLSLSLYLTMACGFPLWIFLQSQSPDFNLANLATLVVVELAAARLGYLALKGSMQPLLLTFWIFVLFWMGFAAFAQTLSNRFYWSGIYSIELQAAGALVVLLGILCYESGRFLSQRIRLSVGGVESYLTPRRIMYLSLMALLLAAYGIYELGGLSAVITTRGVASEHLFDSGDFSQSRALVLLTIIRVPSFLALYLAWYYWLNRNRLLHCRMSRTLMGGGVVGLLGLNVATNFPMALARYWLGTIVLSMAFITFRKTRNTMAHWILFFFFVILIVFPVTSNFRYVNDLADVSQVVDFEAPIEYLYNGDYDAYQQVLNTMYVVANRSFSYGENFLGAALFWVPRSVWQDKPHGTGTTVAEELRYTFTNLSAPLWAESYYALGILGVILVFLAYGYISGYLDRVYSLNVERTSNLVVFVVPLWMGFQIFFLRGDLMNGMAYGLPMLLLMWFVSRKRRSGIRH